MKLRTVCQIGIFLLISIKLFSETITLSEIKIEEKIKSKGSHGNFLGPSAQVNGGYDFDIGIVSGLFEAGPKQLRSSTTLGFCLGSNGRTGVKINAEHLMQDLKFNFYTGSQKKWIHQASGGIGFKHVFEKDATPLFVKSCQLDGYYSYSWSRNLAKKNIGLYKNCTNHRRIAGANIWGGSGGTDLQFKKFKTVLGLTVNYDNVKYDIKNSYQVSKSGFGGSISLLHPFAEDFDLKVQASFRKPFNNYSGEFNWNSKKAPGLVAGVFGGYTSGKHCLASSYDIGVKLSYLFGVKKTGPSHSKNSGPACSISKNYLKMWMHGPSIKMPQIFAISDEKNICKKLIEDVSSCSGSAFGPILLWDGFQEPLFLANIFFDIKNNDPSRETGPLIFSAKDINNNNLGVFNVNPSPDGIPPNDQISYNLIFQSPLPIIENNTDTHWEVTATNGVCFDITTDFNYAM